MITPDNPFAGLPDNLRPNPPADMPEAPSAGDAMAGMSPFSEALDADQIIKNLMLDRPLKLYIPHREKYPDWEFRIINSIPGEIADAHNKGFKEITDPTMTELFTDLVAGTDKNGKAFRPMLMARPKKVGEHIRKKLRGQLQSLYAGMDPSNKAFDSKYAENAGREGGTRGQFTGANWKIRV
jgi:hypothetical protein